MDVDHTLVDLIGEGALAAVLLSALPEGEKPLIVGKPNQPLLDIAQAAYAPPLSHLSTPPCPS